MKILLPPDPRSLFTPLMGKVSATRPELRLGASQIKDLSFCLGLSVTSGILFDVQPGCELCVSNSWFFITFQDTSASQAGVLTRCTGRQRLENRSVCRVLLLLEAGYARNP